MLKVCKQISCQKVFGEGESELCAWLMIGHTLLIKIFKLSSRFMQLTGWTSFRSNSWISQNLEVLYLENLEPLWEKAAVLIHALWKIQWVFVRTVWACNAFGPFVKVIHFVHLLRSTEAKLATGLLNLVTRVFPICLVHILSLYMCFWEDAFHRELQACSQSELY